MWKNAFLKSKCAQVFREMPQLRHSIPGEEYEITRSEVIGWIRNQPEMLLYLFNRAKMNGLITFDTLARTWKGVGDPGVEDQRDSEMEEEAP